MTVGDWLRQREPAAPPALARRVAELLRPSENDAAAAAASRCLEAAEQLLVGLLAQPHAGRECALDLLTVDALVTYAFEACGGNDEPMQLDERAHQAMLDVARLGRSAERTEDAAG